MEVRVCGNSTEINDLRSLDNLWLINIELFISILSAPAHFNRRNAIRDTWATTVQNYSAVYKIFTDLQGLKPDIKRSLINEKDLFEVSSSHQQRGGGGIG